MPIITTKMGLMKPTALDPFSTAGIAANWQMIDDSPGTLVCTSTTRPGWGVTQAWGVNQAGREIIETDTVYQLRWRFDGTKFVRVSAIGVLTNGIGASVFSVPGAAPALNTPVDVCSVSGGIVPAGNRPLLLTCGWAAVTNTSGRILGTIFVNDSLGARVAVGSWTMAGDGTGGSYLTCIRGGLTAGTYTFFVRLSDADGSPTYTFTTDTFELTVVEL